MSDELPEPRDDAPPDAPTTAPGTDLAAVMAGLFRELVLGILGAFVEVIRRIFGRRSDDERS